MQRFASKTSRPTIRKINRELDALFKKAGRVGAHSDAQKTGKAMADVKQARTSRGEIERLGRSDGMRRIARDTVAARDETVHFTTSGAE